MRALYINCCLLLPTTHSNNYRHTLFSIIIKIYAITIIIKREEIFNYNQFIMYVSSLLVTQTKHNIICERENKTKELRQQQAAFYFENCAMKE
jgi:hypothetical protein